MYLALQEVALYSIMLNHRVINFINQSMNCFGVNINNNNLFQFNINKSFLEITNYFVVKQKEFSPHYFAAFVFFLFHCQ